METQALNLPPYGICSPCEFHRCRDGDTVEVRVGWWPDPLAIRMSDPVWCCEMSDKRPAVRQHAEKAKAFVEEVLGNADQVSLFVDGDVFVKGLVKAFTFDRLPGMIYVGTETTIGQRLITMGLGWRTKKEQQAAEAKLIA